MNLQLKMLGEGVGASIARDGGRMKMVASKARSYDE